MKATLPRFRAVNTSARFMEEYIEVSGAVTHGHGMDGAHSHSGTAFTTWLDLRQAAMQAEAIMKALIRKLPEEAKAFEKNYKDLEKDLVALDEEIEKTVSKKRGMALVASHPVYQYFARRYGLNLESVMWEPEEFPSEEKWKELSHRLETHPAKWMIWEGEPNPKSVKRLEELGVHSIVLDPCGNTPGEGDFLSVMEANVSHLKMAFK